MSERAVFDLTLGGLRLECGGELPFRRVRGWAWGPDGTIEHLAACGARIVATGDAIGPREEAVGARTDTPPIEDRDPVPCPWPTVVLVHALTGDMRAGGPGGWWAPVIGPGEPLDPSRHLVLCFNNLGGCYGTTGPEDAEFPLRTADRGRAPAAIPRGAFTVPDTMPATITSWDQARTHLDALDAVGVTAIELLAGGSVGGSQALCIAMLEPERTRRLVPVASNLAASPWIIAWNHIGRQTLLASPAPRGLELARQVAHATYRAPAGLLDRQGRRMADDGTEWSPRVPYAVQTYLEHQGRKLASRYSARAYLCALDAMDHHDALRPPPGSSSGADWSLTRIRASTLLVTIDSDQLFDPADGDAFAAALDTAGVPLSRAEIRSPHGHDAFLIEWQQVRDALAAAWEMPAAS